MPNDIGVEVLRARDTAMFSSTSIVAGKAVSPKRIASLLIKIVICIEGLLAVLLIAESPQSSISDRSLCGDV